MMRAFRHQTLQLQHSAHRLQALPLRTLSRRVQGQLRVALGGPTFQVAPPSRPSATEAAELHDLHRVPHLPPSTLRSRGSKMQAQHPVSCRRPAQAMPAQ